MFRIVVLWSSGVLYSYSGLLAISQCLRGVAAIYSALGQPGEALRAREALVDIYRALHGLKPSICCKANLARELTGLSKELSSLGRLQEALDVGREAAAIYERVLT